MKKKLILLFLLISISIAIFAQKKYNYSGVNFNSIADFSGTEFNSVSDFTHSNFKSKARFIGTAFRERANFNHAKFKSSVDFSEAYFFSIADFSHAEFDSAAYFSTYYDNPLVVRKEVCVFRSRAIFNLAEFKSVAMFNGADFRSTSEFREAIFNSKANFRNARFYSSVFFKYAVFLSEVDFTEAEFDSVVDFRYAHFNSKIIFHSTKLPQVLDLSNIDSYIEEIDLSTCRTSGKDVCKIDLTNTKIGKIKLNYVDFKLIYSDTVNPELITQIYQKLIQYSLNEGLIYSNEKLQKEFRNFKYTKGGNYHYILGNILNWIDKNWWDYSYGKELIIRNTFLLFLIFAMINSILFRYIATKIYVMPKLCEIRNKINHTNKLVLFVKVFPIATFYTSLIFFGLKFDINKLKYEENLKGWKLFNLAYFFIVYVSGLVCLGYLANYVLSR